MLTLEAAISLFQLNPAPADGQVVTPFRLRSSLAEPASSGEIEAAWNATELPEEAVRLWTTCRAARLFEDIDYGQWGLVVLDPASSAERTKREREMRRSEFLPDDVVLGAFLGDQELLVLASSEPGQRRVMIALPLDGRADWLPAGASLAEFLESYFSAAGNKYWEQAARH